LNWIRVSGPAASLTHCEPYVSIDRIELKFLACGRDTMRPRRFRTWRIP
jgi:hypothetical protein